MKLTAADVGWTQMKRTEQQTEAYISNDEGEKGHQYSVWFFSVNIHMQKLRI